MSPDAERDPSIPKAFEVVGEHYRLVKKLGEGSFGVVYEARHDLLGQSFAVKILKPELCEDENLRERFLDEARALIRFSHANVVQLRHVGEHEGRLYLVMDLVKGRSLSEVVRKDGPFPEARAVDFILQVLHGLEAAHGAGIVHRDLKPGNLIVDARPDGGERVRILDFGLSKLSSIDGMQSAHRSATGAIIGTLAYMSPEQLSGEKDIDVRSDIFAAGLILHEMLDGRHPFPGESGIVVAAKLLREPVPELDKKRAAKISDSTHAALRTALERDRDARFPSAFTFAEALEGKGPPSDTSRVTTIQEAKAALAAAEAAHGRGATGAPSKKGKVVLVAAIALVAVAAVLFLALQDGDEGGGTPVAHTPTAPGPGTAPGTAPGGDAPEEAPGPGVAPPVEPVPPPREGTEPGTSTPEAPQPTSPTPPAAPAGATPTGTSLTARDAQAFAAEGKWTEAAGAWQQVLKAKPLSDPQGDKDEAAEALRGVAMARLAEADGQARHGHMDDALKTLDALIAWLTQLNADVYRSAIQTNREAAQRPTGFLYTHRGEAYTARARWLRVKRDAAGEKDALKNAEDDLKLAWQYLDRDGVHYWDFLLRRADLRRLQGDMRGSLEDLALTTKVASENVPTRMWVAHFAGLRRAAEQALMARGSRGPRGAGRPPRRRPAARAGAEKLAEEARRLVRAGETWARTREEPFTREQWIEAARVIVVSDMAEPPGVDRTQLKGLLTWYLSQARGQPRPPWQSLQEAEARLKPLEAELAVLEAKVAMTAGKTAEARSFSGEALAKAREGVRLAEAAAAAGGELPGGFPYVMLAYVLKSQDKEPQARPLLAKALEAAHRNPE